MSEDKEFFDSCEAMMKSNAKTPDEIKEMKSSQLVARIALFSMEMNTYRSKMGEDGAWDDMEKEDPPLYAMTMRMVNATTKDLEMAMNELDLRVPVDG